MQIRCFAPIPEDIAAIVDLDQRALGGLWSADTYLRELESPNSCLRILGKPLGNIEDPSWEPSKDAIDAVAPDAIVTDALATDSTVTGAGTAGADAVDSGRNPAGIIGVGCYWEIVDEAHITVLAIDPCYHRRGLGRWLLVNLLEDACRRGLQRATLEVRASNSRAIALYESFGFEALGTRKRYYPDGEDALILWQNSLEMTDFREGLVQQRAQAIRRLNAQGWQIKDPELSVNQTHP